jgi:hypothetical protein
MDFLTQDTPVWLTVGLFLLSIVMTMLTVSWVLYTEETETPILDGNETVERIMFPTNDRN